MGYGVSRKKRRMRNYSIGVALIVVCLTAVLIISVLYQNLVNSRIDIDPNTLCPVDGPTEVVAILIDSTDPFNGVQKEFLLKYFEEVEAGLAKGTLVQIYSAMSYSDLEFLPVTSLCNPGDGSDISVWSGNPEKVRKKWAYSFKSPLTNALKSSIETTSAKNSPILSMIRALSYKAYPVTVSSSSKKLYIVSDMLEHTDRYSHYTDSLDYNEINQLPFYAHVSPNLNGVEVFIIYISRQGAERIQTRRHATFWSDYFKQVGSSLRIIKRI